MMAADSGDKSHKATPKRMRELRREGSLQRSQDVSAWVVVGTAAMTLPLVIDHAAQAASGQLAAVSRIAREPDAAAVEGLLRSGLLSMLGTMAPLLIAVVLATIVVGAAQGGIHFAPKRLKPTAKHMLPQQGFKRVFGGQAWWNGAKAALKAGAIGVVLYTVVQGAIPQLLGTGTHALGAILDQAKSGAWSLLRIAVAAGLVLAFLDVLVVMRRNRKQTRMSMKEIKDEHKQLEGDPWIKGQIRARQLAMSRNRMMAEIASADVVMVNPTHVAVALRYKPGSGAPTVVAKGRGHVATKIREVAMDHRVPLVADVPLARALHDACELGQPIPTHLYAAVARVLAFVMSLKARGAAAGLHRDPHAEEVSL
ncbi:EscU/YscU/HrcU family type III secretion system export apparatus switch protein [Demequina sp.]|uniref:EscU/YscU/HrcU family type III secretion system export apparatus switch protein n=1 Tax=Demequina sp. TaxID=2050685 RepID=UPI003A8B5970